MAIHLPILRKIIYVVIYLSVCPLISLSIKKVSAFVSPRWPPHSYLGGDGHLYLAGGRSATYLKEDGQLYPRTEEGMATSILEDMATHLST